MSQPTLRPVVTAYRRALSSQFSFRILRMSFVPLLLSLGLGFIILYFAYTPLMDLIQLLYNRYDLNSYMFAGALKMIMVPLTPHRVISTMDGLIHAGSSSHCGPWMPMAAKPLLIAP